VSSITAIILCGGSGERLGGEDKPLQPVAGVPLIERVLARIGPQVTGIVISANRNADVYQRYGHPVVADGRHAGRGPLAGLAAGMDVVGTGDVLCVPGDAPQLPADLVARLDASRCRMNAAVAVVHDGGGLQPLCLLLPSTIRSALHAYLDQGGRAAHVWVQALQPARADFSDRPAWTWSANTPAELAAAGRHLRRGDVP